MNSLGFNKKCQDTKIIVAMSGGVDSSVAAAILKDEGYDVKGVTLRLYSQVDQKSTKSCCAGRDIQDAKKVANQLNFPHETYDYQDSFFSNVIDNFVESYSNGETPIPCVSCNQTVKFSDLLNEAKKQNADALVTGHYVRRIGGAVNAKMFKAKDSKKDQSYFLFATTKKQLDFLRFPLGNYFKSEIRDIANNFKLVVKDKPDSQDICFVTKDSYRELINKLKPESFKKGNIIDIKGNVIGEHEGIVNYTIGQRKGIGIGGLKKPLYVLDIDKEKNFIMLGEKEYMEKTSINIKNINWLGDEINGTINCSARIRSNQKEIKGTLKVDNHHAQFIFKEKVLNTSPGQACVFYSGDQVLGGGWITK